MIIHQKQWISGKRYVFRYSAVFALCALGCFLPFLVRGRSLVWKTDGGSQYLPYLAYMGQYLRAFVKSLCEGQFSHKMFDFRIGMGEDIGSVIRAHPLDFLSVFVPVRYTEYLYDALILLRMYLSGLAFSAFCFYFDFPWRRILLGSIVYVFCGHAMHLGIMHPTVLSALIILPLLLLGAEKILRGQKWYFFTFMTFLGFMSNYYFMYMSSFALAGYVILRLVSVWNERKREIVRREFPGKILSMAAAYLLGFGMSALTLLPTIVSMGGSARFIVDNGSENLLYYEDPERYVRWIIDLIFPHRGTGYNTYLNYASIVLPALACLFARKKRSAALKCAVLISSLMLLVPFCAYAMAGFSNVTNRWVFIYSFLMALVTVSAASDLTADGRRTFRWILGAAVLYSLCVAADLWLSHMKTSLLALPILAGTLVYLCCVRHMNLSTAGKERALLLLVMGSVVLNGLIGYDDKGKGFSRQFMKAGTGIAAIENSARALLGEAAKSEENGTFSRADMALTSSGKENFSLLLGYQGTYMYNSLLNGPLIMYLIEQENVGADASIRIHGFDGRFVSESLAHVKYYLTKTAKAGKAPYGFTLNETLSSDTYQVYENQYPLSFGCTYEAVLSGDTYEDLGAIEKEQVMLKAAVVDTVPEGINEIGDAASICNELNISREEIALPGGTKRIEKTENGYQVKKAKGKLKIPYQVRKGYECYLELTDFYCAKSKTKVRIRTHDQYTDIQLRGLGTAYSLGKRSYLVRLGFGEEDGEDTLKLIFFQKGTYELSGMRLIYVPVDGYEESVNALNREALTDVVIGDNKITGTADLSETRLMMFSIPWQKGWTLYVDGEKQPLLQVNTAYMGAVLSSGRHEIRLIYETPGMRVGALIAGAAWLIYLGIIVFETRKYQRYRQAA